MRRIGTALFSAALLVMGCTFYLGHADEPKNVKDAPAKAEQKSDIDLVICLDTSNSMDGLIAAAKQKLWDVVNTLAKAKPTPNLRVALYSYGNDGYDGAKGWVRKEMDFTPDLDKIFEKLFALSTHGGTEFVTRVSRDAIVEQKWSPNPQALKMIFVCGNERANQDSQVSMKEVAEMAVKLDIRLNTIYCGGPDDADCRSWRELASLAKGQFSNINQSGQVALATPFDNDLAKFADDINRTYVPFGARGEEAQQRQQAISDKSAGLGKDNAAARVQWQSSAIYRNSDWDLVDKRKDDKTFDLGKVPVEQLPENMRKMTLKERNDYLDQMQRQRDEIQKKVKDLSAKRDAYIRTEMDKLPAAKAAERFDNAIGGAIRLQAEEKKIAIPK